MGRADDEGIGQSVAERLPLVEGGLADEELARAAAGDLGREKFGQRQVPSLDIPASLAQKSSREWTHR